VACRWLGSVSLIWRHYAVAVGPAVPGFGGHRRGPWVRVDAIAVFAQWLLSALSSSRALPVLAPAPRPVVGRE